MIAIFTKFNNLVKQIYDENLEMAENCQAALGALDAEFQVLLRKFKFPSKTYLHLASAFNVPFGYGGIDLIDINTEMQKDNGNHQDQVKELTEKKADSINKL